MSAATVPPPGFAVNGIERIDRTVRLKLPRCSIFRTGIYDGLYHAMYAEPANAPLQWQALAATVNAIAALPAATALIARRAAQAAAAQLDSASADSSRDSIRNLVQNAINAPRTPPPPAAPGTATQGLANIHRQLIQCIADMPEEPELDQATAPDYRHTAAWRTTRETAAEAAAWHNPTEPA